ncbi:hypothetical protein KGF56_000415 [Candida oxycetoniae]|uniref:Zn(2)-C6 fungal-type domain-containing protein n=1 Tax=Candida oxycetoniae TaxID=497107 RepID=A0AAI9T297_9ASCO|nr:uncharacterized protein KGF56_000415 [Candida oxycetoniae]KAI3406810.2 hypothetical protein KGF56_000415 [Candida oxycetoniae]
MSKEKRTKPCCNCKKSKVKCVYEGILPCQRCLKTGQAATCHFVTKLPSLKLPSLVPSTVSNISSPAGAGVAAAAAPRPRPPPPPPPPPSKTLGTPKQYNTLPRIHSALMSNSILHPPLYSQEQTARTSLVRAIPSQSQSINEASNDQHWRSQIEERMDSFDTKIDNLVDFLKSNSGSSQGGLIDSSNMCQNFEQQAKYNNQFRLPVVSGGTSSSSSHPSSVSPEIMLPPLLDNETSRKRPSREDINIFNAKREHTCIHQFPKDFRDGFLTKREARDLFKFFESHISQQLFGFEISKFSVNDIWHTCPVLVCAICTIASIHHSRLAAKSEQLQVYLRELCGSLFFQNRPKSKTDAYNTIVALILCSFWLSDSQMFTGLALQLAKEYGLDKANHGNSVKGKEDLKLWYLLYVLDGQQSMAFHREQLVNGQEYSIKHSKDLLTRGVDKAIKENTVLQMEHRKPATNKENAARPSNSLNPLNPQSLEEEKYKHMLVKQQFTDLQLVSQVEYYQALNEVFRGDAWDLLVPDSFGIPSKSNLELDKWMVSWTVMLAPGNYGAVWSSKSTLIYYNFAKMHINSSAVRQLTFNPGEDGSFPKLESSINFQEILAKAPTTTTTTMAKKSKKTADFDSDSEDSELSEEENEFISNKEFLSPDEVAINANIALNAAHTVINLVITDKDILDNLRYVPVHIHIMLYYAVLLLINPPLRSNNISIEFTPESYYDKVLDNLKVVNILKNKIYNNLPTDSKFGARLLKRIEDSKTEKLSTIKEFVKTMSNSESKHRMEKKIDSFADSSESIEEIYEYNESGGDSSRSSTPLPEKISAWPGSHHGHP